jgi:hypothetical protein
MRVVRTIISVALCAGFMPAISQNLPQNDAKRAASCPSNKDLTNTDLFGAWSLLLEGAGLSQVTRLQMQRNPEFAESLAGNFLLGDKKFEVFGDIEDGALDLEESDNGKDIVAIWKGRVVDGSCGQTILGMRRDVASNATQNFVLRRPGW